MKRISALLVLCVAFSLGSCGQEFKKMNDSEVDKAKVKIAQTFASNYLTKLRNGETYTFGDEAVEILKNSLTAENQKAGYRQVKGQFGDYKTMSFAEVWVQGSNSSYQIIRFKGEFDKSNRKLEVRVVLDSSNRIAGFFIKPWSDMLN
jgi:hypothetical protein